MGDQTEEMARRALEVASKTLGRMEAHEQQCADNQKDIKASIGRVHARLDKIIWAILGVMALIAWSLLQDKLGM